MRKTSTTKDVIPHYLDNNNIIRFQEFTRGKKLLFISSLNSLNNVPLTELVDKDLVYKLKLAITKNAEKIDKYLSEYVNDSITDIEKIDSFNKMISNSKLITQELFNEKNEFFKFFINESKTVSRIDYESEEFVFPLEFICYGDSKLRLLGETVTIYRKFLNIGKVGKGDGQSFETLCLSYLPTKGIDKDKKEISFFEDLHKDSSKPFVFNLMTKVKNSADFFSSKELSESNIIHLSCHIKVDKNNLFNTYLNFKEFQLPFSDFLLKQNQEKLKDKILFINGCSLLKNQNNPSEINIYTHFFNCGLLVFISVGSDVYDDLAIDFTKKFYTDFLDETNKKTVQEIIHQIAKDLWKDKRNPIGFFYHTIGPVFTN